MTDRRFLLALYRARSLAFKQRSNASTMAAKDTAFTIVGEFGWPKFWADRIRLGKQAFGKTTFWKTEFWARILGRFSVRPAQAGQSQRWPTSACLEQVWPAKAGQRQCWPNLACLRQVCPARGKFGRPRLANVSAGHPRATGGRFTFMTY